MYNCPPFIPCVGVHLHVYGRSHVVLRYHRPVGPVQVDPFYEVTGGVCPIDGPSPRVHSDADEGGLHVLDKDVGHNGLPF